MADPFIGEIDFFPYNYVPDNYAQCNGQTLLANQYQALYALIQQTYGGNNSNPNQATFNVPNLTGVVSVGQGLASGGGTIQWEIALRQGAESVALTLPQYPTHTHTLQLRGATPNQTVPAAGFSLAGISPTQILGAPGTKPGNTTMEPRTLQPYPGGGGAHENRQPYLAITPCIALAGVFPSFPS